MTPYSHGDWAFWSWACVRATGFPASLALRLASPEFARAVDALLNAEERRDAARESWFEALRGEVRGAAEGVVQRVRRARSRVAKGHLPDPQDVVGLAVAPLAALRDAMEAAAAAEAALPDAYEAGRKRVGLALREIASDAAFREAVTWQNRSAVASGLDSLLRTSPEADARARQRAHEELVASYLHRYATKNDTIGFFGPVGWARLDGDATERIVARPGPGLLAARATYLEQWGIDVLAALLSRDERIWPWLVPHRFGFLRLEGRRVHNPLTGPLELSRAQELALRGCEGEMTTQQLALDLALDHAAEFPTPEAVNIVLKELREKKLISVDLEFGTTWGPEHALRARLERIDDQALREECLRPLAALEAARDQIAAAAGDADRLHSALAALDETFTRLTGAEPTRHAGAMYAARSLAFEDCRRDLDVVIGRKLLDEIAPALGLVLTSARYLTYTAGKEYDTAFRELFATMVKKTGARSVPFADFWFRAQRLFKGTKDRPIDRVALAVQRAWGEILAIGGEERRATYRSADLLAAVTEAFRAPRPGWSAARHHSPDLMIGASSLEAIARGDYFAVLGEIHVGLNTVNSQVFLAQHPTPRDFDAFVARDIPELRVFTVAPKDGLRRGPVRLVGAITTPHDYEVEVGFEASALPRERVLRLGELQLEDDGDRLVVTGDAGRFRIDLLELAGSATLPSLTANALELLPEMQHSPRVTIDQLVVRRESWRFAPVDLPFAFEESEVRRFVGARRWARAHGVPRFAYMRSSLEVKPIYIDFESLVAVNIFAKIVRRAKEHISGIVSLKFSEMLPTLEETWLPDVVGNRYTSEIRLVAVDQRR